MKPAEILRELKKFPSKVLGQNFLVDEAVVRDMIEAAEVSQDETVVEIGPGLGALTFPLLQHAKSVLAIEADHEFAHYLRLKKARNLTVVAGDALKVDWTIDLDGQYKIVANIPYSITSPLLRKIFLLESKPEVVVLLVQKEMAERITAKPDSSERGFLTLLTEANATAKIIRRVKPGSFYPSPKAESSILLLRPHPKSLAETIYWPAIEAGFRHKRQMLVNTLSRDLKMPKDEARARLESSKIDAKARPEDLSFEDWQRLAKTF